MNELAELLGKTRNEVEQMLEKEDIIELKLRERRPKKHQDDLRIYV